MIIKELMNLFKDHIKGIQMGIIDSDYKNISSFAAITEAKSSDLTYCKYKNDKGLKMLNESEGGLILCHPDFDIENITNHHSTIVFTDNPRLLFILALRKYFLDDPHRGRTFIHYSATIGSAVKVGEGTVIKENVVIEGNTTIGNNCIISAGVVIGKEGFAFEKDENGQYIRFPHFGGVIIGDNVEIGANTVIDRGQMGKTIIGNGVKIDNLVHVGHNSVIGKNSIIIAQVQIGGSSIIGEDVWIAMSATTLDHTIIGDKSLIGAGAVVTKNVKENTIVIGNPAKFLRKRY